MKNFFAFLVLLLCLNASVCIDKETLIKKAIQEELELYPEERLVDLYKSFFQGFWGPAHLVKDSLSALDYLQLELDTMSETDTVLIHKLGYYDHYVRVNLLILKQGKISVDELLAMFMRSANEERNISLDEWKGEWGLVISIIERMNHEFVDYESDKQKISELLQQGKYVLHHSEFYEQKYFPHYRVVSVKELEKLKPLLQ